MTLTIAQLRQRIQDPYRYDEEARVGDGLSSAYKLRQGAPHSTLLSASAFVVGSNGQWSGTGATFDNALGVVAFNGTISANTAWKASYQWSVFSDAELGTYTGIDGTLAGASLEVVKTLMFDGLKRARWAAPDGTQYDDTKAMESLKWMWSALKDEQIGAPEGGIESWSEQQAYFSNEYNG